MSKNSNVRNDRDCILHNLSCICMYIYLPAYVLIYRVLCRFTLSEEFLQRALKSSSSMRVLRPRIRSRVSKREPGIVRVQDYRRFPSPPEFRPANNSLALSYLPPPDDLPQFNPSQNSPLQDLSPYIPSYTRLLRCQRCLAFDAALRRDTLEENHSATCCSLSSFNFNILPCKHCTNRNCSKKLSLSYIIRILLFYFYNFTR